MKINCAYANVNGTRLYYELAGEGPGLVLIHGFSVDTRMWDEQFETFARSHRVLRYDMRGFGRSSLPGTEPYDPCLDLAELMDTLGFDNAALIGLSLGGWVAVDFALAYPQKTTALIAADAAIMGFDWPHGRPSVAPAQTAQSKGLAAGKQQWMASELFVPLRRDQNVARRLQAMVADYSGWHWLNENPQIMSDEPAIACLHTISCPTLIIVGEHDSSDFHAIADIINRSVPHSKKVVIADAGHMSNMEKPAEFNRAVLSFLD